MFVHHRDELLFFLDDVQKNDVTMTKLPDFSQALIKNIKGLLIFFMVASTLFMLAQLLIQERVGNVAPTTFGLSALAWILIISLTGKSIKRENYFTQDDPSMMQLVDNKRFHELLENDTVHSWLFTRPADIEESHKLIAVELQHLCHKYFLSTKELNRQILKRESPRARLLLEASVLRTVESLTLAVERQREVDNVRKQELLAREKAHTNYMKERRQIQLESELDRAELMLEQDTPSD